MLISGIPSSTFSPYQSPASINQHLVTARSRLMSIACVASHSPAPYQFQYAVVLDGFADHAKMSLEIRSSRSDCRTRHTPSLMLPSSAGYGGL